MKGGIKMKVENQVKYWKILFFVLLAVSVIAGTYLLYLLGTTANLATELCVYSNDLVDYANSIGYEWSVWYEPLEYLQCFN